MGCKKCGGTEVSEMVLDISSGFVRFLQVRCLNCGKVEFPTKEGEVNG